MFLLLQYNVADSSKLEGFAGSLKVADNWSKAKDIDCRELCGVDNGRLAGDGVIYILLAQVD